MIKNPQAILLSFMVILLSCNGPVTRNTAETSSRDDLFRRENLVAWCIVPFDAADRTPEERAAMLDSLGISQMAYDYRDRHILSFEREIGVLREHGIRLRAVWLWVDPPPGRLLNDAGESILRILERTGTKTELWVSYPGHLYGGLTDGERMHKAVNSVRGILERAEKLGCTLALYNHGDWFGEPENQVRIIEAIGSPKVRIVYNFHHGHHQVERFDELMELMMPHLSAININGMRVEGPKILPLGEGDRELEMLRTIVESGYEGPIGILGHTEGEDIRPVLERNLAGLDKLRREFQAGSR